MRWTTSVAVLCLSSSAYAYNSEEHKLIGDRGSSSARICAAPIEKAQITNKGGGCEIFGKLSSTKSDKPLLKTYDGAAQPDSKSAEATLGSGPDLVTGDWQKLYKSYALKTVKAYKNQWVQSHRGDLSGYSNTDEEFNNKILIPAGKADEELRGLKPLVVWVGSADGKSGTYFTFGDLVALYGDFRKVVTCTEQKHECLLTDAQPDPATAEAIYKGYRAFAHGMTPPIGDLGQALYEWEPNKPDMPLYNNLGWWGDELIRLASVNDWHFSARAVEWYVGMHRLALRHARLAVEKDDPSYLWRAIHYEANGLHSITDLFSPGHMIMDRSRSTDGIWTKNELLQNPVYLWSRAVLDLGRANNVTAGQYLLDSPSSSYAPTSAGLSWGLWAKWEESGHSSFNKNGAEVRNLAGALFKDFGDSRLFGRKNPEASEPHKNGEELLKSASKAVEEGLGSLLDAYAMMKGDRANLDAAFQRIESNRATYFRALLQIPTELRRACYGRREFCYGPGSSEKDWRAVPYRDKIVRFLGISAPSAAPTLPVIDGERYVVDPIYLPAYLGTSVVDTIWSWFDSYVSMAYTLQKGDKGYKFDEGDTKLVCQDFDLPVYEFSILPWK
ncbi:hypothetical protein [Sorangium sp. So ce1099]|uniref:hypothetical protein n=1 Tax=Sorangium sp. So ce1099 TaxID=3133331 RepID=UPI003F63FB06